MPLVNVHIDSNQDLAGTRDMVVTKLIPGLSRFGYSIKSQAHDRIELERGYRSGLVWFLTIITFPIGLIFFATMKSTSNLTVLLDPSVSEGKTRVTISGESTPKIARQLSTLSA